MKFKKCVFFIRKSFFKLVVILLVFCMIIGLLLFSHPNKIRKSNSPCSFINSVTYEHGKIRVEFTKAFPAKMNIHELFGFQTTAFYMPLIFTNESMTYTRSSDLDISFSLDLPFVQEYSGSLYCTHKHNIINKETLQKPKSVLDLAESVFPLTINKTDFDENMSMSQMKCHGSTYETRFCEMRNVAIFKEILVFSTKAKYVFPRPFLTTDSRAPPFGRKDTSLLFEPHVIDKEITSGEVINELTYVMTQFNTTDTTWNNLVDFIIPAYETFSAVEKTTDITDRRILIKDEKHKMNQEMFKCLTKRNIEYFNDYKVKNVRFRDVVVGMKKIESNPSLARAAEDFYKIKYLFNNSIISKARENIMNMLEIKSESQQDMKKVLILENKSSERSIINIEDVEQYMRITCFTCDIQTLDISAMNQRKIIEEISSSNVVIGMNSNDLANAVWMKPHENAGCILLELLPKGFTCNNNYKELAQKSSVHYFSVIGTDIPGNETENENCTRSSYMCATKECYDVLQNQNVYVDFAVFTNTWEEIVELLGKN